MSELVTTYKLNNSKIVVPMKREEFYKEQIQVFKKTGKPTRAVAIIDIMLFDRNGELYVQKRADTKAHNPGLMDKSIGGHIQFGDSDIYTVMVESVQELQVPSITLKTEKDFAKTFMLLTGYLNTVAVIKRIDKKIAFFKKIIKGEKITIANEKHLYFGVYTGAIKTVDREAKGILLYNINDLEKEIKATPQIFTDDLRFYLENYKAKILEFIQKIKEN